MLLHWRRKNSGASSRTLERSLRLRRIFDETKDLAWRSLRRLGVPAELVEDSFQQVFLIVSERLDDIVSGKERSFVYGVTLRVARTYRRYEGREELGEEADLRAAHQLSQDSMLDTRRLLQACDAILAALRPELREAFVLHDLEQLSGAEIARLLDIPEGTVHTRLRRARLLVRGELQELEASASTMEARRG